MNEKTPEYQVTEKFQNLAYSEAELTAELTNSDSSYTTERVAKKFVRSRLYVGLAVRSQYWSWSTSDDFRSGYDREVLAMNLLTGAVEWMKDGGNNDGYPEKGCLTVNATLQQREQALAWLLANGGTSSDRESYRKNLDGVLARARQIETEAAVAVRKITKGSNVKVTKGRKVPVGTTGVVVWVGQSNWGPRVGISPSGKMVGKIYPDVVWIAEENVEINDPLMVATAEKVGEMEAKRYTEEQSEVAMNNYGKTVEFYRTLLD